jgi:hypothetical protein
LPSRLRSADSKRLKICSFILPGTDYVAYYKTPLHLAEDPVIVGRIGLLQQNYGPVVALKPETNLSAVNGSILV